MNFLISPKRYRFSNQVILSKTKFNYKVSLIQVNDLESLNEMLKHFPIHIKIFIENTFMNGKDTKFIDEWYQPIEFIEDRKWILTVILQGYKLGRSNNCTPICKIEQAQLCN